MIFILAFLRMSSSFSRYFVKFLFIWIILYLLRFNCHHCLLSSLDISCSVVCFFTVAFVWCLTEEMKSKVISNKTEVSSPIPVVHLFDISFHLQYIYFFGGDLTMNMKPQCSKTSDWQRTCPRNHRYVRINWNSRYQSTGHVFSTSFL